LDGKYQFRFSLDHPEEKKGDFMVSISGKDVIKVYLNGVRIHIDLIPNPKPKPSK
jgi:hypothetical protein